VIRDILVLDYETAYSDAHTLTKLTTEAYVRGPEFEPLCLGVKSLRTGETVVLPRDDIGPWMAKAPWPRLAVVHHHAQFDGLISSHHYGVIPAFYFDTMAMARVVHGQRERIGLAALAAKLDLGVKTVPYASFKNKRWDEMLPWLKQSLMDGCADDCELTAKLFFRLLRLTPRFELEAIDMTTRLYTQPRLVGDTEELLAIHEEETARKAALLASTGYTAKQLRSSKTFVAVLEELGVEVAYKQGTNGLIPATAKTDDFMQNMLVCGDEQLEALAEAKLAVGSSIVETRALRMAGMSTRGRMPVYIAHAKQQTGRGSGGDKCNWRNLPRKGRLRGALKAPAGMQLVVVDLSAIELRVFLHQSGQRDILDRVAAGADIYAEEASAYHERPITKDNPDERGTFKQVILSGQYGSGAKRLQATMKSGGYGPRIFLTDAQADAFVKFYREKFYCARQFWRRCENVLHAMVRLEPGETMPFGPCTVTKGKITHDHTGAHMHYEHLFWQDEPIFDETATRILVDKGFNLRHGPGWHERIWGSKFTADYIQWLSRIIFDEKCLILRREFGLSPCLTVYDEWVGAVPVAEADKVLKTVEEVMRRSPVWLPDLPLDCEGKIMERYGK
jgi:hypothetical protein